MATRGQRQLCGNTSLTFHHLLNVDMLILLANSCCFTHSAAVEQIYLSFEAVFLATVSLQVQHSLSFSSIFGLHQLQHQLFSCKN